jgi:hypothetical protein
LYSRIYGKGIEPGTDVKKSEIAKALIELNVSPEYALTVEDQPKAKTAWEYFRNLFKGKNNARILQLKRDLSSLRQKPGCYDCAWLSLTALSTVTRNLWL